ncbi:MAG: hypothetical protein ACQESR_25085 [Planctomycetota bacterium]
MKTQRITMILQPVTQYACRLQNSLDGRQPGWFCYGFVVLALWGLAAANACGGDEGTSKAAAGAAQSAEAESDAGSDADIRASIRQLDANRFSKRQDAGRRLKERGMEAIAALRDVAESGSREASSRALRILKEHFSSGEGKLKAAAKAALEKLADSDKALVARTATEILRPEPEEAQRQGNALGQRQIQVQLRLGGAARRVQIQNVNGVKNIEVKENNRTIEIEDHPQKGIKVEITEKKDGKDVKQRIEAKNAAELKKKNPEAHKLYQKYGQGGGARIQANVQAIQIPARIQKALGRPRAAEARRANGEGLAESLDAIADEMEKTQKLLEQLKSNPQNGDMLRRAIEQLKKTRGRLKETRKQTE